MSYSPCYYVHVSWQSCLIMCWACQSSLYIPLHTLCMQVSNIKLYLTSQEPTCLVGCLCGLPVHLVSGVGWQWAWRPDLALWPRWRSSCHCSVARWPSKASNCSSWPNSSQSVDGVVLRLDETDLYIHDVAGDLDYSAWAFRWCGELLHQSKSMAGRAWRKKILKAQLRGKVLHELNVKTESTLRATGPPFVPATESRGFAEAHCYMCGLLK